jgi:hypothetical protein
MVLCVACPVMLPKLPLSLSTSCQLQNPQLRPAEASLGPGSVWCSDVTPRLLPTGPCNYAAGPVSSHHLLSPHSHSLRPEEQGLQMRKLRPEMEDQREPGSSPRYKI